MDAPTRLLLLYCLALSLMGAAPFAAERIALCARP